MNRAFSDGRTWDRNEPGADRLGLTWADFERLLQGVLVDAEGRPISLSATGFHSSVGRIKDRLAGSECWFIAVDALGTAPLTAEEILARIDARAEKDDDND